MTQGRKTSTIRVGDRVECGCPTSPFFGEAGTILRIVGEKAVVQFEIPVSVKQLTWLPTAEAFAAHKEQIKREHLAAMRGEPLDAWAFHDEDGT